MNLSDKGRLRLAVRLAFMASVGITTGAYAQADSTAGSGDAVTTLKSVTVTGTRIKSKTMTASSPVTEINGEDFIKTGASTVENLVNLYPQLNPVFDNTENNGSLGYATVDLRGLGAERTLALINGHRMAKGIGETADLSIIPAGLVKNVDVLTGGASAVYGSDAVAGVVNFVLDTDFEGMKLNAGWGAFQHNNDNLYMQGLMDTRFGKGLMNPGQNYATGDSGFDGKNLNIDFAIGGKFGDRGHAMGWATWRKNDPVLQGQRDYSGCALNAAGTRCGGSATADPANFYIADTTSGFYGYVYPNSSQKWLTSGSSPQYLYNFAPINYFQRPDERFTAGTHVEYEINEYAKPYVEAMLVSRKSTVQLAPSGAFFTDVTVNCGFFTGNNYGDLCNDVGITDAGQDFTVYVAKRNTEGGPRVYDSTTNNWSIVSGVSGKIWGSWSYDASLQFTRAITGNVGTNDFLTDRIQAALLDGSYSVWTSSVTAAEAQALQGTSMQQNETALYDWNAFASGDLGIGLLPNHPITLAVGYEYRRETFAYSADSNLASGNFSGSGSESPSIDNGFHVNDIYMESGIPLLADVGPVKSLDLQLGFRNSSYQTSGNANAYKIGFGSALFQNKYHVRGGYNRAIRAPNIGELYSPQAIGLWGGTDPCAGSKPEYTAAQCANTGVTSAQYGKVPANAASQYNQIGGGNTALTPEKADTWTFGLAAEPIKHLQASVDYYNIKLTDAIGGVGSRNILDICALTGDTSTCALINRNPSSGDLFRTSAGYVENFAKNLGGIETSGVDFTASYWHKVGPGKLSTTFVGNYVIEKKISPIAGNDLVAYDCAGNISPYCQTAAWRHVATINYAFDRYSVGARWRYTGRLTYEDPRSFKAGAPLTADRLVASDGGIPSYSWFDLNGSVKYGPATLSAGINNLFDKEPPLVGAGLATNANAAGGYDQLGRFFFTNLSVEF